MYQIHLRTQASKLVSLTARWSLTRAQQHVEPRQHLPRLRAALAALANLATLRVMPDSASDTVERQYPCDPRNW